METQNIQPQGPGKWYLSHKFLYSVLAVLFLVLIVGAVYWYQEEKKTVGSLPAGQAGNQETETLAGVDADNNGLRDDVDQLIMDRYSNMDEIKAAQQYAISVQEIIVNSDNSTVLTKIWTDVSNAERCLRDVMGLDQSAKEDKVIIEARIRNTAERNNAYFNANRYHPVVTRDPIQEFQDEINNPHPVYEMYSTCNFIPSMLLKDWKTYTNTEYGFEFKYPTTFPVLEEKNRVTLIKEEWEPHADYLSIEFSRASFDSKKSKKDNLITYAKSIHGQGLGYLGETDFKGGILVSVDDIFGKHYYDYFEDIFIDVTAASPSLWEVDSFNQILSTFKFTK